MNIIISLMGGLGLFLYGMNLMGEGLQKSAGTKLKKIIKLLTSNLFMGVLVGTGVTAVIQSSSATTVMVVGFVNAGIMTLKQAIGVIMGANIGTTVTAQLVSFDLAGMAPVALGIGIILYLFGNKPRIKNIAEILIGFGILFTGMDFMKMAVEPLKDYQGFTDLLVTFGNYPLLGLLLGFGITAIIQSSSASMGMLVALAAEGLIPLAAALPILYGQNIGTCVTSLLSSIGANKNARRAAMMHLIFNVLGTVIFLLLLNKPIVNLVTSWDPSNVARQIANTHTLFNIISVLILLPFTKVIIKLAIKLVPDKAGDADEDEAKTIKYIDDRMIETPSIALANTIKEALRMGEKAKESLNASMEALVEHSTEKIDKTYRREKLINDLQKAILNYLLKLSKAPLDDNSREVVDTLFNTVNDIERIGDHAKNIAELSQVAIDSNISFSEEGQAELDIMYNKVVSAYTYALESMRTDDVDLACKVIKIEEQVDIMEKSCRANHMYRLNNNLCSIENGVIYLDVISNLERISDHAVNIAQQVIAKRLGTD
ncbi:MULTISPECIES: Na/Pi cotransporter family protein [unclassified Clostridioides]|uniref:Na/Pi cotransporter family protein n=1 Tax=unclassified Clostridioides TaxID=2635829 RepID=UPI001D0BFE9C|nr:Na/Pi cotransporter family protein [Clostridioides sp. ES-S-0001-02]MCC0642316.1 Na/Pi cotransporter family protein [Clostridioides sp. ES-S-0049-03]MCC0651042.1 Na/Pi cotransporter family protein [Clostridioides sp. ES-S-0001-03]MCC0656194.1 Na/Pi cotransporter family protein [Clostridioides sp. ES-S-0123-01]MCC0671445.1 Na/Pi cotransporter family protein [Clostridioides sp. ES-S-0145-01]MCC0678299.1 Na/Pi cotransporter family protein [Clostridioides sp. ES-W-0018-02]MCC0680958.1 Na/Pi co